MKSIEIWNNLDQGKEKLTTQRIMQVGRLTFSMQTKYGQVNAKESHKQKTKIQVTHVNAG